MNKLFTDEEILSGRIDLNALSYDNRIELATDAAQRFADIFKARAVDVTPRAIPQDNTPPRPYLEFVGDAKNYAALQSLLAGQDVIKPGRYGENIILGVAGVDNPLALLSYTIRLEQAIARGTSLAQACTMVSRQLPSRGAGPDLLYPTQDVAPAPKEAPVTSRTPISFASSKSHDIRDAKPMREEADTSEPEAARDTIELTKKPPLFNLDFLQTEEEYRKTHPENKPAQKTEQSDPYRVAKGLLGDLQHVLWTGLKDGDLKNRIQQFLDATPEAKLFGQAHDGKFYSAFADLHATLGKLVSGSKLNQKDVEVLARIDQAIDQRISIEKTALRALREPGPQENEKFAALDAAAAQLKQGLTPVAKIAATLHREMRQENIVSFSLVDFRRNQQILPEIELVDAARNSAARTTRIMLASPEDVAPRYVMDAGKLKDAQLETIKKVFEKKLRYFLTSPEWNHMQELGNNQYLHEFGVKFALQGTIREIKKMNGGAMSPEFVTYFDELKKELPKAANQARTKSCPPSGDNIRSLLGNLSKNCAGVSGLADEVKRYFETEKKQDHEFYAKQAPVRNWQENVIKKHNNNGMGV